jgi:hypothetical protein
MAAHYGRNWWRVAGHKALHLALSIVFAHVVGVTATWYGGRTVTLYQPESEVAGEVRV